MCSSNTPTVVMKYTDTKDSKQLKNNNECQQASLTWTFNSHKLKIGWVTSTLWHNSSLKTMSHEHDERKLFTPLAFVKNVLH